jgi:hypothetical protein
MSTDTTICDRIRRERRFGSVRCGIVEGKLSVVETACAFGLAGDSTTYRSISGTEASTIATRVLRIGMAHRLEIMSAPRAADLWQQFLALFYGQEVEFASNTGTFPDSWTPATSATFDMGVLVVGTTTVGCLWVEEED